MEENMKISQITKLYLFIGVAFISAAERFTVDRTLKIKLPGSHRELDLSPNGDQDIFAFDSFCNILDENREIRIARVNRGPHEQYYEAEAIKNYRRVNYTDPVTREHINDITEFILYIPEYRDRTEEPAGPAPAETTTIVTESPATAELTTVITEQPEPTPITTITDTTVTGTEILARLVIHGRRARSIQELISAYDITFIRAFVIAQYINGHRINSTELRQILDFAQHNQNALEILLMNINNNMKFFCLYKDIQGVLFPRDYVIASNQRITHRIFTISLHERDLIPSDPPTLAESDY